MAALTLAGIPLPDLHWADEFAWTPVVQSTVRTEAGLLVREESGVTAGRPITLAGGDDYAWASRALVQQLHALQQTPNAAAMTLILPDARTFAVVWRREGTAAPMDAKPVRGPLADPQADESYSLTLRLLTV